MSKNFEFNAPQYVNFSNLDDSGADSFFDAYRQESYGQTTRLIMSDTQKFQKKLESQRKIEIENEEPNTASIIKKSPSKKINSSLRKALHEITSHQIQKVNTPAINKDDELFKKFENWHLSQDNSVTSKTPLLCHSNNNNEKDLKKSGRKSHHMITRLDMRNNKIENQFLSTVNNNLKLTEQNLQKASVSDCQLFKAVKRHASPISSIKKFISLAEQVEHFHKDTPERYRFKPNRGKEQIKIECASKPHACIPKTPNLTTKFRQRKINFPDMKKREEMELEEIKKHQVKAHPLNEKILMGPSLNLKMPIMKKPTTIPQPFSLTEIKKKEPSQDPVFHFKAQPLPSSILKKRIGVPPKRVIAPTIPTTPRLRIPKRLRVEVKSPEQVLSNEVLNPPRNTKVEPFSFDSRTREILQKKQDFINKFIEEEQKAFNSFKAQPMPLFKVVKSDVSLKLEKTPHKTIPQPFNLTQQSKKEKTEPGSEIKITPFKARPASVIRQKPFMPKLDKHDVILPPEFHLNTEKRALERQKFDEKIRKKEEEWRILLKLQKEEEEKLEKQLALEERKKAEFKAKPVPRYKPFEIHGSDPEKLTLPQSPKFSCKSKETNKVLNSNENCK